MRQLPKVVALSALATLEYSAVTFFAPAAALAHPGHDGSSFAMVESAPGVLAAFCSGLTHPWTGVDHLLALVGVALWSLQLGGRFPKLLSLTFLGSMAGGIVLGALLGGVPAVESLVVCSLVVFGGLALVEQRLSTWISCVVVAVFASLHGVAHGAELASGASLLPYLIGSICGAAMVLLLTLALATRLRAVRYSSAALRSLGAAIVLSSLLF